MEISSELIQFNERLAICAVSVQSEKGNVTVHASALASEGGRYADLAQSRALALARQVLEGGLEATGEVDIAATTIHPVSRSPATTPVAPPETPQPETNIAESLPDLSEAVEEIELNEVSKTDAPQDSDAVDLW